MLRYMITVDFSDQSYVTRYVPPPKSSRAASSRARLVGAPEDVDSSGGGRA